MSWGRLSINLGVVSLSFPFDSLSVIYNCELPIRSFYHKKLYIYIYIYICISPLFKNSQLGKENKKKIPFRKFVKHLLEQLGRQQVPSPHSWLCLKEPQEMNQLPTCQALPKGKWLQALGDWGSHLRWQAHGFQPWMNMSVNVSVCIKKKKYTESQYMW